MSDSLDYGAVENWTEGRDAPLPAWQIRMGPIAVEDDGLVGSKANRAVNCARGLPSIPARREATDGRVAIVGYGPSLEATWPALAALRGVAIWTTSKAHDFLLERGITPTHHTDVEWREYKASYNTRIGAGTRYLLASHSHPAYLDRLAGARVELFHVEFPGGGPYEPRYVRSEVAFDAGLQAARVAYQLGYRVQVWFGMDASAVEGSNHAGPHPNPLGPTRMDVRVGDRVYRSNNLLVRQAVFCEKMLCKLPHLRATITGDGMLRPFLQERRRVVVR